MLKSKLNRSFTGAVLFFSVLFLGLFFRTLGIDSISAWGDEVASLYYAQHIDRVFFYESHSPFYYGLCKIWISIFPESVVSLRYMFISLSLILTAMSTWLLYKKRGVSLALVFFVLFWLWPTDIIFSRQARHYSLFLEMTVLILILWDHKETFKKWLLWPLWMIFQLIHPFALIPVWFLIFYDFFKKKLTTHDVRFYLSTTLPLISYYVLRFIVFGKEKVLSNISWIDFKFQEFQRSLFFLFVGDSYPLTEVYPLSMWSPLLLIFVVGIFLLFGKRKLGPFKRFFLLYILTVITIEVMLWVFTNVRINRYYIYLIPFFLFALMDLIEENPFQKNLKLASCLALGLVIYNIQVLAPWRSYTWDDQNVDSLKSMLSALPKRELIICANAFQQDYYFQQNYQNCSTQVLEKHLKKESFYLFDLTGNDRMLALFILNNTPIDQMKKFNQALFLSVSYPPKK